MKRLFYIFLIAVCTCTTDRHSTDEVIIKTVGAALDSATYASLENEILVHIELPNEPLKSMSIENLFRKYEDEFSPQEQNLLKDLYQKSLNGVDFKFPRGFKFRSNTIVEGSPKKNTPGFGHLSLVDAVINNESNQAAYYFALDCADVDPKCSFGYVAFVKKVGDEWIVYRIRHAWHSGGN